MLENKSRRAATPAEVTALTTYAQQNGAGKTAAQMAAELNAPGRTLPNPAPPDPAKAALKAVITKASVQNLLTSVVMGLIAANPVNAPLLAKYQYVQGQVNAHDGDYAPADVAPYAQQMIADGLATPQAVLAMTTDPDPNYLSIVSAGPLAFTLLGAAVSVEASDFA